MIEVLLVVCLCIVCVLSDYDVVLCEVVVV